MGLDADAVIVGGGLAGVRAARDLGKAGAAVLLLEARDRLGGRAWTRRFTGRHETIEMGGAWVAPTVHPFVAEEIARYDLKLLVSHGGSIDTRWRLRDSLSSDFPINGEDRYALERALFRIIEASHRIDVAVPRDRQDLADLDVSVESFVDALEIPASVRDFLYLWAGLGSGALPSEWSALTALSWIAAMDNSVYGWYGAVTDRFEIGMGGVVEQLATDSGATVLLASPVRRVTQSQAGVEVVTLEGARFTAASAIVATPIATWPDIEFAPALPADKMIPALANHAGRMKKTWMVVEGLPGNLFASGWGTDFVQLFPELEVDEGFLTLGMCSAPSELDTADLEAATAGVRQFAPGARVLATDMHNWAEDPYSKGGWMVNPPGILTRYHSALGRREGVIAFAGSDLAVRWIGWLDGALETGARAAGEVLALLEGGRSAPL